VNKDLKDCEAIARRTTAEAGPARGKKRTTKLQGPCLASYADCLKKKGKTDRPPYPDWYGDD